MALAWVKRYLSLTLPLFLKSYFLLERAYYVIRLSITNVVYLL